jgi:hypothetical protein
MAMLRLRWAVAADEIGAAREARTTAAAVPARRRLQVVDENTAAV